MSAPEGFDFRPVVEGATVPLRGHATWVDPQDADNVEGRLDMLIVPFDGKVDGVEFTGGVSVGGEIIVHFARPDGEADTLRSDARHSYTVSPRDAIAAAWEVEKRRRAMVGGAP